MKPLIKEVHVKTVLTKTGIPDIDYCMNPYVGCAHACRYCYATFMKRFTGHTEPWGSFVDVKINAPEVLRRQLKHIKRGNIIISSVTDPYQPAEAHYKLTRRCLEALIPFQLPIRILTKSPLVLRDIDIITRCEDREVGLTITTDDDRMRGIFEPAAPPVAARIEALKKLHEAGINTYAFIGPLLPMNPESLAGQIQPYVSRILIDRMNYAGKTGGLFRKYRIEQWLDEEFVIAVIDRLKDLLSEKDILIC